MKLIRNGRFLQDYGGSTTAVATFTTYGLLPVFHHTPQIGSSPVAIEKNTIMAQLKDRQMSGIKFASFQDELFQLKFNDNDSGQIEGYGSVFNVIDEGGDIVLHGAYANVLEQFLSTGFTAESHNWDFSKSIGYPIAAHEDDYGLHIVRQFYNTPDAQNIRQKVRERLEAGKAVGLSVGFTAAKVFTMYRANFAAELPKYIRPELLESQLVKAQSFPMIRVIQEVQYLFEDSIVCSPMNRMALATRVKSLPYINNNVEMEGEESDKGIVEDTSTTAPVTSEEVSEVVADVVDDSTTRSSIPTPPPTPVKTQNIVEQPTADGIEVTAKNTTIAPLSLQPDFKGGLFGDYISENLTFGTICRLTDIMLWSLIYETVLAKTPSKAEKLEMLGQIIAEYAQHVMNVSAALLTDDDGTTSLSVEAQQERKHIEAGIPNPFFTKARDFLKVGSPLAGLTFQEHSQLTLAVSKEYSNRLADIVMTRLKEGRKISTNTLNRMRAWYDSLVEMTSDLGELIAEVNPDTEKGIATDGVTQVVVASDAVVQGQDSSPETCSEKPFPELSQDNPEPNLSEPTLEQVESNQAVLLEELRIKAMQQRALVTRDALSRTGNRAVAA